MQIRQLVLVTPWVLRVVSWPSNELEYAEKIPRVKDYHRCQDELRKKENDINVGLTSTREKSPSTKFPLPHQIYASILFNLFIFKNNKKQKEKHLPLASGETRSST